VLRRDQALIAMAVLTGARDSALASLRLKHIDLSRRLVMQDPREVRTKRSKRIDTFFFPIGDDFEIFVTEWIRYLREERLYGHDDPVFPRTAVKRGGDGSFVGDGLEPVFWENTAPIRRIFPGGVRPCRPALWLTRVRFRVISGSRAGSRALPECANSRR
jgi:hypothetical protein